MLSYSTPIQTEKEQKHCRGFFVPFLKVLKMCEISQKFTKF